MNTLEPVIPRTGGDGNGPVTPLTQVYLPSGILAEILDALRDHRLLVQDADRARLFDLAITLIGIPHIGQTVRDAMRELQPAPVTLPGRHYRGPSPPVAQ